MPQMRVAPHLWSSGATELIPDTSKTNGNKQTQPPQNVKCKGPPWGKLMSNWPEGAPALCVWIVYAPVIFHCEFLGHDFAEAHGSVSEGVVTKVLGGLFFQDFVFKRNRCLSEFLTFHNHKQEYRPLNPECTKEGER